MDTKDWWQDDVKSLELPPEEAVLIECLEQAKKGRLKACAKSAIHHLARAQVIKEVDPEMAAFRAITAEEEMATALIFVLQEQKYPNAKKLDHRKHEYKAAIWPFFIEIGKYLRELKPAPGFPAQLISEPNVVAIEQNGKMTGRTVETKNHITLQGILNHP